MCGGSEMANKSDSGVEVVHDFLTEGGNSIRFTHYQRVLSEIHN